ncbi:MAG: T9SS type A sorting domain-containing protein [Fluviicola sp.]|nr:T9SS type A sorting domain-containing protein [Fluviicola sp.]
MKKGLLKWSFLVFSMLVSFAYNAQNFVLTMPNTDTTNCNGIAKIDTTIFQSTNWYWTNSSSNVLQQGGNQLNNLCAGTYMLKYNDSTNTLNTYTFNIVFSANNQNNCASLNGTFIVKAHNPNQSANCNGGAAINAYGGTAPYNFQWSNTAGGATISTNDSIFDVCSGNYFVKITDANNCFKDISMFVPQDTSTSTNNCSSLNGNFTVKPHNPNQSANCNGGATINAYGGTAPYSFQWSNTQAGGNVITTNDSLFNVCSGTYFVKITDANNCFKDISMFVPQDTSSSTNNCSSLNGNFTVKPHNPNQSANCNGGATINAYGGTAPYSFQWSNTQAGGNVITTNDSLFNVCSGTYFVKITDANNCFRDISMFVPQDSSSNQNNNCANFSAYISNLIACTDSTDCNGTIDVTANGGQAPYNYSWSTASFGNVPQALNVCAGNYNITVTDSNGCYVNLNAFVPYADSTSNNNCVTLNGNYVVKPHNPNQSANCNGGATINAYGGTAPYSFQWSNTQAGGNVITTNDSLLNVCSGTYFVKITDANNCFKDISMFIPQDTSTTNNNPCSNFTANLNVIPVTDSVNCNGGLNVVTNGGSMPFNFTWTNATSNGPQVNNLCSGNYSVTVVDANNCTLTLTAFVPFNNSNNNPCANFNANVNTVVPASDSVNCNGMVNILTNGGLTPYTFNWSQSSTLNSPQANNLCPGNYTVIVTDANNCNDTLNVVVQYSDSTVVNPCSNFTANLQIFPTTDSTSCNGGLNVFTNGGVAPFNFSWSNAGVNTPNANNLCIGNYTVTVVDANACTVTLNGYVPFSMNPCANSTLQVALTSTNVTANPCNGSITSTVNGGIGQYYYLWNTGATSTSLNSVCQGMYSLTVKDSLGCQRATSIYVGQAIDSTMALNAYVIPTGITQAGICDGSASVVAFGGVTPYSYAFDNGTSNQTATGLCSGLQNVTVTDAAGSSITLNFIISSPQNVIVNTTYQDSTVVDSLYNPAVSNCTIDYSTIDSVFISNISFITADSAVVTWTVNYGGTSSVNLTNYYVILSNAAGVYNFVIQLYCPTKSIGQFLTASSQYYIDKSALGITSIDKDAFALVYPNPFNDNLSIALNSNLENTITISDVLGKVVYSTNINAKNIAIDTRAFSNGNYILTIENKEGRFNYKLIK